MTKKYLGIYNTVNPTVLIYEKTIRTFQFRRM